LALPTKNFNRS